MRRQLLGMLAMGAGDGLRRPVNAPPAARLQPGVQPGASSAVVTASRVIVIGANGGIFSYAPSAGAGNLTASTGIAAAGTDPYGNAYLPGDTTYYATGGTVYVAVNIYQDREGFYFSANGEAGPWTLVSTVRGDASGNLTSTASSISYVLSELLPASALLDTPYGGLAVGFSSLGAGFSFDGGDIQVGLGWRIRATSSGTSAAVWEQLSLINGWTAQAGNAAPALQLLPLGMVAMTGVLDGSAATAAEFASVGVTFQPASVPAQVPCGATAGVVSGHAPYIQVTTAGAMSAESVTPGTAGMSVVLGGMYPLDAP